MPSSSLSRELLTPSAGRPPSAAHILDHYVESFPTPQNAIDAVPGWNHAFPPAIAVTAGAANMYGDERINWCLDRYGSVKGQDLLELGPLEGMHTYMLDQRTPRLIDAIEANKMAYFRCLVTKELLGIKNAKFHLGDFYKWLEETNKKYDLIIASGVLYHSSKPVHLLELLAKRSDAVFIWTHYFDDAVMPLGERRRAPFTEEVEIMNSSGIEVHLHVRSYYQAYNDPAFCGGLQDRHFWIERQDILDLLKAFGFNSIEIAHDQPDHVNGPSFSILARRLPAAQR